MDYSQHKPIYLQIADSLCDKILSGEWTGNGRIPSVREFAADMEVNPNTILRAYEHLEREGILFNKRGIGYFVSPDGIDIVRKSLKKDFIGNELPALFKTMKLLDISMEDLRKLYESMS